VNVRIFVGFLGDFVFSDLEWRVLKRDAQLIASVEGVSGIVFGALTTEGKVDVAKCKEVSSRLLYSPAGVLTSFKLKDLVSSSTRSHLEMTFHRAIDMGSDPIAALNTIASANDEYYQTHQRLLINRVLTSGGSSPTNF